jgi:hypothetical protein
LPPARPTTLAFAVSHPVSMDLSEYFALTERIATLRTRQDIIDVVRIIAAADLEPGDRRRLARKLAAAARTIDPALAIELLPDLLPKK